MQCSIVQLCAACSSVPPRTAMSKMCRFVLTGDLLRLNETALPPFAQHLVLADEEPQNCERGPATFTDLNFQNSTFQM